MLFRYAIINVSKCSFNTLLILFWNIAGVFISLNCIINNLYNPFFNLKAAFYLLVTQGNSSITTTRVGYSDG